MSEKWKILIAFALLLFDAGVIAAIVFLAKLIALGDVVEASSAGLTILLMGLIKIAEIAAKETFALLRELFGMARAAAEHQKEEANE